MPKRCAMIHNVGHPWIPRLAAFQVAPARRARAMASRGDLKLSICRRCKNAFNSAENHAEACRFHSSVFTGGEISKVRGVWRRALVCTEGVALCTHRWRYSTSISRSLIHPRFPFQPALCSHRRRRRRRPAGHRLLPSERGARGSVASGGRTHRAHPVLGLLRRRGRGRAWVLPGAAPHLRRPRPRVEQPSL